MLALVTALVVAEHDGDGGNGGADGVKEGRLRGAGGRRVYREGVERGAGEMECGGIADGSCPRTEVLKRRSHGIARTGGKGKEARQTQKGEKRQQIPLHGRSALLWECVSAGVFAAELSG